MNNFQNQEFKNSIIRSIVTHPLKIVEAEDDSDTEYGSVKIHTGDNKFEIELFIDNDTVCDMYFTALSDEGE